MTNKQDQVFDQMVLNAIDFLKRASKEVEKEPKYAVLHLATAIEIFLKARLVHEHWTIIVKKDAEFGRFLSGDFQSITISESIRAMHDVVGKAVRPEAKIAFEKISNHRNRVVHYFSSKLSNALSQEYERSVGEILASIYFLDDFVRAHQDAFAPHSKAIAAAINAVRRSKEFLGNRFKDVAGDLTKAQSNGFVVRKCRYCSFKGAIVEPKSIAISKSNCLVCESTTDIVRVDCPDDDCGHPIEFWSGEGFQLVSCVCGNSLSQSELFDLLDTRTQDDHLTGTQINCGECTTAALVADADGHFVCCECLFVSNFAQTCGWCSEAQIGGGDLEFSQWSGCEFCDGRAGWDRD